MNTVLCVAPHPDDETLGCAGALLKHRRQGDAIHWLIVTNISEDKGWPAPRVKSRQNEINKVGRMYGFKGVHKLDFPTMELDHIPKSGLVKALSGVIAKVKPQVIYLPNRSDVHTDHQEIFKAAFSCTKNFRFPFIKKILMYEVPSETDFAPALNDCAFVPNVFVDITPFMAKKLSIMKVYASEIMKAPFPRSMDAIRALAACRGSQIGKPYAEAFVLLKEID